ncbi:adenosylmethionine decarboxylase [Sphingobacterium kyonggiense]|uniref:Adenosylmethionine decarboxylase n=1 Tax=Sphingobacterium kyonggiense TaxID=714075 RepID=A0ABP7YSM7_9SPHI
MFERYKPGKHLLLTLQVSNLELLCSLDGFMTFCTERIKAYDLQVVGLSSHVFDGDGYTAAICLKESHICIHTWPEFNQLTLDIYLCNYLKDNSEKVFQLGEDFKKYFEAEVLNETMVNR